MFWITGKVENKLGAGVGGTRLDWRGSYNPLQSALGPYILNKQPSQRQQSSALTWGREENDEFKRNMSRVWPDLFTTSSRKGKANTGRCLVSGKKCNCFIIINNNNTSAWLYSHWPNFLSLLAELHLLFLFRSKWVANEQEDLLTTQPFC